MPTLNTRIKLKYDTLANWSTANPVLLVGEVAVVAIPTESESTVGQVTKPAIVFKVGDGTSTFTELPYASGLAADVYAWAKKASLAVSDVPNLTTAKITDFTTAVESIVDTAISEIPSVEVPEYTLRAGTEEGTLELVKDGAVVGTAVEVPGWAEVAAAVESLGALATKDTIVEADISGTIAASKISGLGALATKNTIVEGDISGTIAHTKISGLGTAATANANTFATAAQGQLADTAVQPGDLGTAAEANVEDFATAAQGGKADTAIQNVSSSGSGVATGFTKSGTNIAVTLSQVTDAMVAAGANIAQSKINGLTSVLANINSAIDAINTDIEGLGNALHFAGAGATLPGSGEDGDVYVITSGDDAGKEYIWANGAWQEFGDTSDYLLASTAQATYVPQTRTVNGKQLNANIELTASDVEADPAGTAAGLIAGLTDTLTNAPAAGSTITAFDQVGGKVSATFAPIAIAGNQIASGTVPVARIPNITTAKVTGLDTTLSGINDSISALEAADTAINAAIANVEGNIPDISGLATKTELTSGLANKQDTLTAAQLNAVNSGITAAKVGTYDGYAADIAALESKPGLDKVGTVTSVAGANGIKVTGTATTTPVVEIDTAAVFILDCGTATTNID